MPALAARSSSAISGSQRTQTNSPIPAGFREVRTNRRSTSTARRFRSLRSRLSRDQENLTPITTGAQEWRDGDIVITGSLYEDRGHTLVAAIHGLTYAVNR